MSTETSSSESSSSQSASSSLPLPSSSVAVLSAKQLKRRRRKEKRKANKRQAAAGRPSAKALRQRRRRARWREKQLKEHGAVFAFLGDFHESDVEEKAEEGEQNDASIDSADEVLLTYTAVQMDASLRSECAESVEIIEDHTASTSASSALGDMLVEDDEVEIIRVVKQKKKKDWGSALYVKESSLAQPLAGLGLFAKETIPPNTKLLPYIGVRLDKKACMEKFALNEHGDATQNIDDFRYVLELPGAVFIDSSDKNTSNATRYVNHNIAKRCNCKFTLKGNLASTKRIFAGEELFVNYAPWFTAYLKRKGVVFATDEEFRALRARLISAAL